MTDQAHLFPSLSDIGSLGDPDFCEAQTVKQGLLAVDFCLRVLTARNCQSFILICSFNKRGLCGNKSCHMTAVACLVKLSSHSPSWRKPVKVW